MERKTFSISFFVRRARTSKKGLAPILARITTNGISKEVYIQCSVAPDKWNQAKERATGKDRQSQQVNTYIDDYRAKIAEVRQELISKGYEGNAFEIKDWLNTGFSARLFIAEFAKYCTKRQSEVGVRITQLTANKYHRLLQYLKEYTSAQYKKEDIPLEQVNYEYIDGLNTFMQTAHNCKNNGAKVNFYLRHKEIKKDGTVPIMGRITIGKQMAQFSAKLSVAIRKIKATPIVAYYNSIRKSLIVV